MKFDVTKLTYAEIEKILTHLKGTPFFISKLGGNVLAMTDVNA